MDNLQQQEGFTVVSSDKSFFFFDSFVIIVRIKKDERPIVKVTGSNYQSVLFDHQFRRKTIVQTV